MFTLIYRKPYVGRWSVYKGSLHVLCVCVGVCMCVCVCDTCTCISCHGILFLHSGTCTYYSSYIHTYSLSQEVLKFSAMLKPWLESAMKGLPDLLKETKFRGDIHTQHITHTHTSSISPHACMHTLTHTFSLSTRMHIYTP